MKRKIYREDLNMSFITNYIDELNLNVLTNEEQMILFKKLAEGNLASRENLILHNLRLVLNIAKNYVGSGLEVLEIFNMGVQGLITAVDTFDYNKGTCFSTYAYYHIKGSIIKGISQETRNVRIPTHLLQETVQVKKYISFYHTKYGVMPSPNDISINLNLNIDKVKKCQLLIENEASLNALISNSKNSEGFSYENELMDIISESSDEIAEFEKKYLEELLKQKVIKAPYISTRDKEIILYRFGFITGKEEKLETIGNIYGITKERVRIVIKNSLELLKNDQNVKALKSSLL